MPYSTHSPLPSAQLSLNLFPRAPKLFYFLLLACSPSMETFAMASRASMFSLSGQIVELMGKYAGTLHCVFA